jgi:hypothetical protein
MLAFVIVPDNAIIHAPFTLTETDSLNGYQASGAGHPFTCGNEACRNASGPSRYAPLRAAEDGWHCDHCGYTQGWAWAFMADESWKRPGPWPLIVFTRAHGEI